MKVGFVGLGMLGLPMALAMASRGHRVRGFDLDPGRMDANWYTSLERGPNGETLQTLAARCDFRFAPLDEVVAEAEILFVTAQTPNLGSYDGTGSFPPGGAEYDLRPLREALATVLDSLGRAPVMARILSVVSTVLPGTLRQFTREFAVPGNLALAHTPAFSAVGSFFRDLAHPEFVLVGTFDGAAGERLEALYRTLTDAPVFCTTPENAELIKTSYNGYIGLKIGFANALMELAHKTPGCDVDAVADCLSLATQRLVSPRYLRGGLGDGGGCHPKENAALANLAQRVGLSFDPFGNNLASRDRQTAWLAELIEREHKVHGLPIWQLGSAFKPNVDVETGSAALLLFAALAARGLRPRLHDPMVPGRSDPPGAEPALFVLAMPHDAFAGFVAARGSVIVDPWRRAVPAEGVRIVAIEARAANGLKSTMRIWVMENGLLDQTGHHFNNSIGLAQACAQRSLEARFLVHRNARSDVIDALRGHAVFRFRPYAQVSQDPLAGALESLFIQGRAFAEGFGLAASAGLGRDDIVFVPTTLQSELYGCAVGINALPAERRPRLILNFMVENFLVPGTLDLAWEASLYRFAIRGSIASCPLSANCSPRQEHGWPNRSARCWTSRSPGIRCSSTTQPASSATSPCPPPRRTPVQSPCSAIPCGRKASIWFRNWSRQTLACIGWCNWQRLAGEGSWEEVRRALDAAPNVERVTGSLDSQAYYALLARADIVLLPYNATLMPLRSSGVFSEAVAAGKVVVVPHGTWMADHLAAGHGAGTIIADPSPEGISSALAQTLARLPDLRAQARRLAPAWCREQSIDAYLERALHALAATPSPKSDA